MPNVFARTTKISNAVGRSAYISNKTHKQEEVLLHEEKMVYSWQFYHEYELKHQHNSGQAQNEAREILLPLPNGLASKLKDATTEKQREKLKEICDVLTKEIIGENHDYEYAVHWNHSRTNLHCHLMFSEREVMDASKLEQKTYAKDIWQDPITHKLTKKGTGELVHKKGDLMFKNGQPVYKTEPLSAKDTRYKEKSFMIQRDLAYQKIMSDHGYEFDINDNQSPYLSQKKLYKGASADYIAMAKDWNAEVKRYNENVKEHIQEEPQMEMEYISIKRDVLDNVREANRAEKKITRKAIDMVKSMADYVQNKVIEVAHRIENSFDHLADWWQENRERLMGINSSKHDLKDSKEMLENLKEVEENRRKQLENELRQALRHQEREKVIVEDMRLYGLNRGNAELMCDQKPAVKEFVMAITDDIQSIQRLYQLPPIDRQKLIAAVYDEPQKVVSYLTRDYNRGMYRDVSHVMEQLEILHNSDGIELEIPRLQKPISRSHDFDLSL